MSHARDTACRAAPPATAPSAAPATAPAATASTAVAAVAAGSASASAEPPASVAARPGFSAGALPFFLAASPGQRFCMYYPPAQGLAPRGAILYVHPFGEELNKSRRMAALQARAFARSGYAVLQVDLYGCGDSSGEFGAARWHIWKHDLLLACDWLAHQVRGPISLWGLRLGALLALDLASHAPVPISRLILWYPVYQGRACIDQLLRQHLASRMLAGADAAGGVTLRQHLAGGLEVEIGGYALAPALVEAIDQLDIAAMTVPCPIFCCDAAGATGLAPAAQRQGERWRAAGVALQQRAVAGVPFWNGGELLECPALLAATAALLP